MKYTTEQQAHRVIKKLRQCGCHVLNAVRTPRGVVIEIEQPTTAMAEQATEIRQQLQGIASSVYTLQMEGCIINWKQGGEVCSLQ